MNCTKSQESLKTLYEIETNAIQTGDSYVWKELPLARTKYYIYDK